MEQELRDVLEELREIVNSKNQKEPVKEESDDNFKQLLCELQEKTIQKLEEVIKDSYLGEKNKYLAMRMHLENLLDAIKQVKKDLD